MPRPCCLPVSRCMWSPRDSAMPIRRSRCAATHMCCASTRPISATCSQPPWARVAPLLATARGRATLAVARSPDQRVCGGAEGIRTPDLLIANETRYQLRHSPGTEGRLQHRAGTARPRNARARKVRLAQPQAAVRVGSLMQARRRRQALAARASAAGPATVGSVGLGDRCRLAVSRGVSGRPGAGLAQVDRAVRSLVRPACRHTSAG